MSRLLITFDSYVNELVEPIGGTFYHHEEPAYSKKHNWHFMMLGKNYIGKECIDCGAKVLKNDSPLRYKSSPTKYLDAAGRPSKDMPPCQPEIKGIYGTSSEPIIVPKEKSPVADIPANRLFNMEEFIKQQKEKEKKDFYKQVRALGYKPSKLRSVGVRDVEYVADKI